MNCEGGTGTIATTGGWVLVGGEGEGRVTSISCPAVAQRRPSPNPSLQTSTTPQTTGHEQPRCFGLMTSVMAGHGMTTDLHDRP